MDEHFFSTVEKKLEEVTKQLRPMLLAAHGNIEFVDKPGGAGPVTELDKSVEQVFIAELKKIDPSIGVMGEESGISGSKQTYWVIDPIDGTRAFIRGLPYCANMIALIDSGVVKYSFVYQFVIDKLYTAKVSKGAYLNGRQIHLKQRPLEHTWLISHATLKDSPELLQRIARSVERVVISGDIMAVASGALDAYMSVPDGSAGGVWDYAPRALIYSEAGARVANAMSKEYDLNVTSLLAAHPDSFDELQSLILSASS